MSVTPAPGERYTIRQKILKIFGNAFHIYGENGQLVGFCKQRAFKFKEDLRFYTDETAATELFRISARNIIDFGATYDVLMPDGVALGSLRQKGFKSILRDEWLVFSPDDQEIARIQEDSTGAALARRFLPLAAMAMPQRLHIDATDGTRVATLRTHFNPLVYRLGVTMHADHAELDDLLVLGAGCLFAAVEGRQRSD